MDFNDNKPLNSHNMRTKLNELQQEYSDMMIAFSIQLTDDGHIAGDTMIKIDTIYKNNILLDTFLNGQGVPEYYRNELENEGYGYLCNYYKAIGDIFKLRQNIAILQRDYHPTLLKK